MNASSVARAPRLRVWRTGADSECLLVDRYRRVGLPRHVRRGRQRKNRDVMPKISRSYLLLSLCLMLVSVSSGCATVSVATAGTIAGIAASSISTGAEVYR